MAESRQTDRAQGSESADDARKLFFQRKIGKSRKQIRIQPQTRNFGADNYRNDDAAIIDDAAINIDAENAFAYGIHRKSTGRQSRIDGVENDDAEIDADNADEKRRVA